MSLSQTRGMSIATRPNRGDLATGSGNGSGSTTGISRPPKELLPDGGNLVPAPAPAPERVLAQDALHLLRLMRLNGPGSLPPGTRSLVPDVESVHRQLLPIRSRRSLAASYRREAFHERVLLTQDTIESAGATRVAYVLRWLELGPDRS